MEANLSDKSNPKLIDPQHAGNGRLELVKKYNINDKAHSDSSTEDFVSTVSKFHHANPETATEKDCGSPEQD